MPPRRRDSFGANDRYSPIRRPGPPGPSPDRRRTSNAGSAYPPPPLGYARPPPDDRKYGSSMSYDDRRAPDGWDRGYDARYDDERRRRDDWEREQERDRRDDSYQRSRSGPGPVDTRRGGGRRRGDDTYIPGGERPMGQSWGGRSQYGDYRYRSPSPPRRAPSPRGSYRQDPPSRFRSPRRSDDGRDALGSSANIPPRASSHDANTSMKAEPEDDEEGQVHEQVHPPERRDLDRRRDYYEPRSFNQPRRPSSPRREYRHTLPSQRIPSPARVPPSHPKQEEDRKLPPPSELLPVHTPEIKNEPMNQENATSVPVSAPPVTQDKGKGKEVVQLEDVAMAEPDVKLEAEPMTVDAPSHVSHVLAHISSQTSDNSTLEKGKGKWKFSDWTTSQTSSTVPSHLPSPIRSQVPEPSGQSVPALPHNMRPRAPSPISKVSSMLSDASVSTFAPLPPASNPVTPSPIVSEAVPASVPTTAAAAPKPPIPPSPYEVWTLPPSITTELEAARVRRAQLDKARMDAAAAARRALHELDMAQTDLRFAEGRRRVAADQLEQAKSGVLGTDYIRV